MKAKSVLNINIPNPCSQNWEAMTKAGDGKHCSKCNNIVYDFSQMSDDELLNFLKLQPATHCGRFHQTQLGRNILPAVAKNKIFLSRFNKIAAAIFAVLSFKALSSNAGIKNVRPQTVFSTDFIKKNFKGLDKVIISGTIKDAEGKPLEKAKIIFDTTEMASTDKDGNFSFDMSEAGAINHTLYFSYEDLITVVRTYHPAMLSASYDVVLNKPSSCSRIIMGGIGGNELLDLPSIVFKPNASKLNNVNRKLLSDVAAKLKANPGTTISVVAYPEMCGRQYIYSYRVENIKKYLVEKEGISPERITTNCDVGGGGKNIVDIKSSE
ncbi:peptidase associated/transthyretin-like domain-containing protein [Ferruginibacter sp.]